jgi:TolA-binding protein
MKIWKPILSVLWLVALILLLLFYIIPQEEASQNDTIEKLEKANKVLEIKNTDLDTEIQYLKKEADSLNGLIIYNNQTIESLKNQRNENINIINNMSDMELYSYFARFKTIRKNY